MKTWRDIPNYPEWFIFYGEEDFARESLKDAIGYVNKKLKLNVLLDVDVQFGKNYGEVH